MKFSVFCLSFLLSFTVVSAQVSKSSTQETAPAKSGVVVKKTTPAASTEKSSIKQVTPSNQKKPVAPSTQKKPITPVNPNKASDARPNKIPVATPKDITGYWLTANKGAIIQFYKEGAYYHGKVVWQKQSMNKKGKPITDVNNPDKSKRKNPVIGSRMIYNLKFNPKTKMYEGGKAYQPQSGRTFDCKAKLVKNNDVMEITGMAGFSLMSKTLVWTRTNGVPSK